MDPHRHTLPPQGPFRSQIRAQLYTAIASGTPGYRLAFGEKYENVWKALAAEDEKNGTAKIGR